MWIVDGNKSSHLAGIFSGHPAAAVRLNSSIRHEDFYPESVVG
jgi:hypothetical protein